MDKSKQDLLVRSNRILEAFPNRLEKDVRVVIELLTTRNLTIAHPSSSYKMRVDNEPIILPGRIYCGYPKNKTGKNNLTPVQQVILSCLYLRHHDGYVRQFQLECLIDNQESFVIPFKFQLIGEYIVEILDDIYEQHLTEESLIAFQHFMVENPAYWETTKRRIVSYWNEFYRIRKRGYRTFELPFKNYIGKKLIERLDKK